MPCCNELTEEVLDTDPVCVCVRGELVLDGERGGRLAAAFGEAIMDLTLSDRTCMCGGEYTSPPSAVMSGHKCDAMTILYDCTNLQDW